MPRRIDLPPELLNAAMRVADAYSLGLSEARLRGTDLVRPFHGVRMSRHLPLDVVSRCAAYTTIMGAQQFFSHETAALLYGCPLPAVVEADTSLHVSAPRRSLIPKGRGIIGHLCSSPDVTLRTILLPGWGKHGTGNDGTRGSRGHHITVISPALGQQGEAVRNESQPFGLRVPDPCTLFLSLAGTLSRNDLVVVGDYLVRRPAYAKRSDARPFTSLDELRKRVDGWAGRHSRAASAALCLVREGSDSRPETLLRLLLTDAGLPEPELNVDVRDTTGRWIARVDLLYREFGVVVEYDGDQHRTSKRQYERDIRRAEDLLGTANALVRVRSSGLGQGQSDTVRRVSSALRAAGWTP